MKNNNIALLWVSSVICLLPIILAFVFYADLPEQVAVHWNSAGTVDLYLPKWAAAFGLPVFLTAVNIVSQAFRMGDPKRENIGAAMTLISRWLVCVISVIVLPVILFIALGYEIPVVMAVSSFAGILIVVLGNYLPKCRQNYTVGIKLPWTLHDVDNWNKTHRMAGRLWIFCGVAMILGTFLLGKHPSFYLPLVIAVIALMTIVPIGYSYRLFSKTKTVKNN